MVEDTTAASPIGAGACAEGVSSLLSASVLPGIDFECDSPMKTDMFREYPSELMTAYQALQPVAALQVLKISVREGIQIMHSRFWYASLALPWVSMPDQLSNLLSALGDSGCLGW